MVVVTRGVYMLKVFDTGVVVELVLYVLVFWGSLECNGLVLQSV